jgi:tryptophan synthase alpha chain
MNSVIDNSFIHSRQLGQALLCPFLTAGYPNLDIGPDILLAVQAAGGGCIELGIPFSDPIADGPTIQDSYRLALEGGTTVERALAMVKRARTMGVTVPILAMASYSIIFKRGCREFAAACLDSGINGLVLPDLPMEEAPAAVAVIQKCGLGTSLLVAPTTSAPRKKAIGDLCDAFIYYVSVSGITGERNALPTNMAENLQQLKKLTKKPICVGFGISTPAQVQSLRQAVDGIIVGSAVIRHLREQAARPQPDFPKAVGDFIADLASGLRDSVLQ